MGTSTPSFSLGACMGGSVTLRCLSEKKAGLRSKVMVPFEHTKFEVSRRNPDRVIQQRGKLTEDNWQCMMAN